MSTTPGRTTYLGGLPILKQFLRNGAYHPATLAGRHPGYEHDVRPAATNFRLPLRGLRQRAPQAK